MPNAHPTLTDGTNVITRCDLTGMTPTGALVHVRRGVSGTVASLDGALIRVDVRTDGRLLVTVTAHPEQLHETPAT